MIDTLNLREIIKTPPNLKGILKDRPDWDSFFMGLTYFVSTRSSCHDRKIGAILVKGNTLIGTGYNGAPRGIDDCMTKRDFCQREANRKSKNEKEYFNCPTVHSEVNALVNNNYIGGPSTKGATLYTSVFPCTECSKLLINAGVKDIVYAEGFQNDSGLAMKLFEEAGVKARKIEKSKIAAVMYKALEYLIQRDESGKK